VRLRGNGPASPENHSVCSSHASKDVDLALRKTLTIYNKKVIKSP